jgi:hypothetical protein
MRTRNVLKDSNWMQTIGSIIALLFTVLGGFGLITPEQAAEAGPIVSTTLGAVATIIAGVTALIALFFKPSA